MKEGYSAKFTVMVDEALFNKIEDYRFANRFQTRKEAIIDILEKGIAALEAEKEKEESK